MWGKNLTRALGIELISDAPPVAAVPPHLDEVVVNPAVVAMGPADD